MNAQSIIRLASVFTFVTLVGCLALVYVWPEHLYQVGLSKSLGRVLLLHLISLLLLLGGFQTSLSAWWRRLSLGAAFVVLSEASMIALLNPTA